MNLVQFKEDSVTCISFDRESASPELLTAILNHESYTDNDSEEHMYSLTVTDDLQHTMSVDDVTKHELIAIRELMDVQNASYFRFI